MASMKISKQPENQRHGNLMKILKHQHQAQTIISMSGNVGRRNRRNQSTVTTLGGVISMTIQPSAKTSSRSSGGILGSYQWLRHRRVYVSAAWRMSGGSSTMTSLGQLIYSWLQGWRSVAIDYHNGWPHRWQWPNEEIRKDIYLVINDQW